MSAFEYDAGVSESQRGVQHFLLRLGPEQVWCDDLAECVHAPAFDCCVGVQDQAVVIEASGEAVEVRLGVLEGDGRRGWGLVGWVELGVVWILL